MKSRACAGLAYGLIRMTDEALTARFKILFEFLTQLIVEYRPNCTALESGFVYRNAGTALKLGQARGVILAAAGCASLSCSEYSPREVKKSVVGYGAAEKSQVQLMMRHLLSLQQTPESDAADALAVAWCHAQRLQALARGVIA